MTESEIAEIAAQIIKENQACSNCIYNKACFCPNDEEQCLEGIKACLRLKNEHSA